MNLPKYFGSLSQMKLFQSLRWKDAQPANGHLFIGPFNNHIGAIAQYRVNVIAHDSVSEGGTIYLLFAPDVATSSQATHEYPSQFLALHLASPNHQSQIASSLELSTPSPNSNVPITHTKVRNQSNVVRPGPTRIAFLNSRTTDR